MSRISDGSTNMALFIFRMFMLCRMNFRWLGASGEFSTFLSAPLRQQDQLIGTLSARRTELRPFTPAQIKLLETFADQAVIAIENVRLFQRTQRVVGTADGDE